MSSPEIEILPDDDTPSTPPVPPPPTSVNSAVSATLSAKARGNKLVSIGNFKAAAESYSDALISLPNETYLAPTRLALLTNRALCYLSTKQYKLCCQDCDSALTIDASNVKAWFRRARALYKLGELKKAIQDLKQLLAIDTKNKAAKKLARTLIAEYNKKKATSSGNATSSNKNRTFNTFKTNTTTNSIKQTGLGLYDDKLDSDVSEHARLLERIRVAANREPGAPVPLSSGAAAPGSIEKTFAALLKPEGFRQRIFPGLTIPEG